jgi:snRNA-activating protein complex subunit 3
MERPSAAVAEYDRLLDAGKSEDEAIVEARKISGEAAKRAAAGRTPLYTAREMRGVTFNDLSLACGKHYSYQHQGDCEHVMTIRDIRLAHADDPKDRHVYPLRIFRGRPFRRRCQMCDVFDAKHVTIADELAPCSPCFFCDKCFEILHLDENGRPVYAEYTRYPYHHE